MGDGESGRFCLDGIGPMSYVVGPLLFTLYTASLQDVIETPFGRMIYGDDTQVCVFFSNLKSNL